MKGDYEKTHNSPSGMKAKVEMRRRVLELLQPARVFDAFCGPDGEMWRAVWKDAASYIGCDTEWSIADQRRRFVADNRIVMRSIDLCEFNVFDLDAFGSPWEQMLILASRRPWAKGERGALCLTDGSALKTRFGGLPHALAQACGLDPRVAPSAAAADASISMALTRWTKRVKVKPLRMWRAESRGSGKGGARMVYLAMVFEGLAHER